MASIKGSVMAIKEQSTQGTYLKPTSASDYLALQSGYEANANIASLTNEELAGTIGASKSIQGAEEPTVSFSHYIKGSGTDSTETEYADLLKGIMGSKSTLSSEYDTVSSSTTTLLKVDTGEGVNYERGTAVMVKDASNGYSIRNVLSVLGDDLTINFALPGAPASGVNLGKSVLYKPANTHSYYTAWLYEGNGTAIQMIGDAKVESMSMTANPTSLINAQFGMKGTYYGFDPIVITSSNKYLDYNDGGVKVLTLTVGTYKTPKEMVSALQALFDAQTAGMTVSYSSSTGKFTISKSSGTLSLLWATGSNTSNSVGSTLGFSVADDTSALSYTSDSAITLSSPQTASLDSTNALVGKNAEFLFGSSSDTTCAYVRSLTLNINNTIAPTPDICEESGFAGSTVTAREISIEVDVTAQAYDVDKFDKYINSTNIACMFNCGTKSGGNWVPGKCFNFYSPSCTISGFQVGNDNDEIIYRLTIKPHVASALGEFYMNTL